MNAEQNKLIGELYVEMHEKLLDQARKVLHSQALAEEVVHDTFAIACQNPEKVCGSRNPQGWLMKTLYNTIRNSVRSRKTARGIAEKYLLAQAKELAFSEDRVDLKIVFSNMAHLEEFRLISEMAIEGRSHKEMADARGITVAACKKRVERAKKVLQRKI